jgi:hypothetical protein
MALVVADPDAAIAVLETAGEQPVRIGRIAAHDAAPVVEIR